MNKFIKRLIATGLSVATVLSNFNVTSNAFDWNDDELNWVNFDNLNKNGLVSKKSFFNKNYYQDVVKLDSVEKYVDKLIKDYNNILKQPDSIEKYDNILSLKSTLVSLNNLINLVENNHNFIYLDKNPDHSLNYGTANLGYKKEINSNHNKENLEILIDNKINPILKNIDSQISKISEKKLPVPGKMENIKIIVLSVLISTFIVLGLPNIKNVFNYCEKYYNRLKKNIKPKIS